MSKNKKMGIGAICPHMDPRGTGSEVGGNYCRTMCKYYEGDDTLYNCVLCSFLNIIKVKSIHWLGGICPTQAEGVTEDNESILIRYRHGKLGIDIDNHLIFSKKIGEDNDGYILYDNVVKELFNILDFSNVEFTKEEI